MAINGTKETAKRRSPKKKQVWRKISSSKQVICYNHLKTESQKRKRSTYETNNETKSAAMKRAEDVQMSLPLRFPSMIKYMLPSHVTGGFWLGLPKKFCDEHLPKEETMIVLEDEEGGEYETKYLPTKVGLSGGWRGFSIAHDLVEGDVVVFQLVSPTKFKVYIVRANGSEELDGALGLLKLEAAADQLNHENSTEESEETVELISLLMCKIEPIVTSATNSGLITDQSEDENNDGNELRLSDSVVKFDKVESFEHFEIQTNGLVINSELSKHLEMKYYDLCCSRKMYLHEKLLEGLNCKLAAGVIAETINIADAIRASKASTSSESFETWRVTLEAFKKLGMNVDFLLEQLDRLRDISANSRKCKKIKAERNTAEEEMRNLERRILELKKVTQGLDQQLLEMNCVDYDILFEQVAKADWRGPS